MKLEEENEMLLIALKEIMKRVEPTDPLNPSLDFEYTMAKNAIKAGEAAQSQRAIFDPETGPDTAEEVEANRILEATIAAGESRYRESLQSRMDL
jgi:hypothetical protein